MNIQLSKPALKYINSQDKPTKQRLKQALEDLSKDTPIGDIAPLVNNPPFFRLRVDELLSDKTKNNKEDTP